MGPVMADSCSAGVASRHPNIGKESIFE